MAIYLLVPYYDFSPRQWVGDKIYSPYKNWKQTPLNPIHINNSIIHGTKPDSIVRIYPFLNEEEIVILDSVENEFYSPFLLGRSGNDLQYLINTSEPHSFLVYKSDTQLERKFQGINAQIISDIEDLDKLDKALKNGIKTVIFAGEGDSGYLYNMLLSSSASPKECLSSLKRGENLLVISQFEIFNSEIEKIPVIRKIEWEDNELYLDLSQKGNIQIISSDFTLDTLSSNLRLKINDSNWFRFMVSFDADQILYISNSFFKYSNEVFDASTIKTNNQLTIFLNLSWLIGIILMNSMVNRLRKNYL